MKHIGRFSLYMECLPMFENEYLDSNDKTESPCLVFIIDVTTLLKYDGFKAHKYWLHTSFKVKMNNGFWPHVSVSLDHLKYPLRESRKVFYVN